LINIAKQKLNPLPISNNLSLPGATGQSSFKATNWIILKTLENEKKVGIVLIESSPIIYF